MVSIGVIGAGSMGNGIAHVCALAGHDVSIYDRDNEAVQTGLATISKNLARQVSAGKITDQESAAAFKKITASADPEILSSAQIVLEAGPEEEAIKQQIYKLICPLLHPDTILATSSSSISITRLSAATDRPEKFIGIHFMNPVPMMQLVEIVRGVATSDETFQTSMDLCNGLGKEIAVAEDFPAFIVNRILIPMVNEAIYVLFEGISTVEEIDRAMMLGANHRMGPLQLADFIGLDTCLSIMKTLNEELADRKYRPCPLLIKYVEAGRLGRKSGRGFYDYSDGVPKPV